MEEAKGRKAAELERNGVPKPCRKKTHSRRRTLPRKKGARAKDVASGPITSGSWKRRASSTDERSRRCSAKVRSRRSTAASIACTPSGPDPDVSLALLLSSTQGPPRQPHVFSKCQDLAPVDPASTWSELATRRSRLPKPRLARRSIAPVPPQLPGARPRASCCTWSTRIPSPMRRRALAEAARCKRKLVCHVSWRVRLPRGCLDPDPPLP